MVLTWDFYESIFNPLCSASRRQTISSHLQSCQQTGNVLSSQTLEVPQKTRRVFHFSETHTHTHARTHLSVFISLFLFLYWKGCQKQDQRGRCQRVTGVDVRCHKHRLMPLMLFLLLSAGCLTDKDLWRKTQTGLTLCVAQISVAWRESADAKSKETRMQKRDVQGP